MPNDLTNAARLIPDHQELECDASAGQATQERPPGEAQSNASDDDQGRDPSQANSCVQIAKNADAFRTADGKAFVDVWIDGHRKTWPVTSEDFKDWLTHQYYLSTRKAPTSEALKAAINSMAAQAKYDGPQREVFLRVGSHNGKLYLDLCNDAWQAIEISENGWRLIDRPPVRFRRTAGMKPLPVPDRGGSIDRLRPFLNVRSDSDFVLLVCWILAALRDTGPYPVLVVLGEQGSAKSTFLAVVRALIDPMRAPGRSAPRNEHDLMISANNGHLLAFDNLSEMRPWLSDALCRLATGAGFSTRRLYSNSEEVIFEAARPTLLNGITNMVSRPDLADRSIFLSLEPISDAQRKTQAEFWAAFETEKPQLLGALLDTMSVGLRKLPNTTLPSHPRMADFATWGVACETAFCAEGTFLSAYEVNRIRAVDDVLDGNPAAAAVRDLIEKQRAWRGTASDLLAELEKVADARTVNSRQWPGTAHKLSGELERAATFLRKQGIEIKRDRVGKARQRIIDIAFAPEAPKEAAISSSAASATSGPAPQNNGSANPPRRTQTHNMADPQFDPSAPVRHNHHENKGFFEADAADAENPQTSAGDAANPKPWSKTL